MRHRNILAAQLLLYYASSPQYLIGYSLAAPDLRIMNLSYGQSSYHRPKALPQERRAFPAIVCKTTYEPQL